MAAAAPTSSASAQTPTWHPSPTRPPIDFHYHATTRAPRAWDREPPADRRAVWKRYGRRTHAARGGTADAETAPRVVLKRRCVVPAPRAQHGALAAGKARFLATASERALVTPKRKMSRRGSLGKGGVGGKEEWGGGGLLGGEAAGQDEEDVAAAEMPEVCRPGIEVVVPSVRTISGGSGLLRSPMTTIAVRSGTASRVNATGSEDDTSQLTALSSTTDDHSAHSQEVSSPDCHGETSAALTSQEEIDDIMMNPSCLLSPRPTIVDARASEECTTSPHGTPVKEIPENEHIGSRRRSQRLSNQTRENHPTPGLAPISLNQDKKALELANTPNKESGSLHECGSAEDIQEKALFDNAAVNQQALQVSSQSLNVNITANLLREHEEHKQTQNTRQSSEEESFEKEDREEKIEPPSHARDQLSSPPVGDELSKRIHTEDDTEGNLEGHLEGNLEGILEGNKEGNMEATTAEAAPARPEYIDGGEPLVNVEEKNFVGRTRSGARFSDDTNMLKDFISRAQARKAARTTAVGPETITTPRRSPRKILGQLDSNSPSPTKSADVASHPGSPPGKSIADLLECDDSDELCSEPVSYRRSGRTCLATKAPPGAPSFIPVRRADGMDPVVLQKSVAQELAIITRANTRRNKGSSKLPQVVLESLAGKVVEDIPAKTEGAKAVKSVEWDERLVYFHETSCSAEGKGKAKANKAETRAKKRRTTGLGSSNGTPAAKVGASKIAVAPAGTPAPRRRGKTKA